MLHSTSDRRVTEGRKDDAGKARWDLVPWGTMSKVAEVLTYGAEKYGDDNWRAVPEPERRYFAAAMRHMVAWQGGEACDPESGLPHLAHAMCCLMFIDAIASRSAPDSAYVAMCTLRGVSDETDIERARRL